MNLSKIDTFEIERKDMQSKAINNLDKNGFHLFGPILDSNATSSLYKKMTHAREFGQSMFISEEEYQSQTNHFGTNPNQSFNFLNQFNQDLEFIESHPHIISVLGEVLGEDYEVVLRKAVCGVPENWLPAWVNKKIEGVNVANLGPFIKAEFRDITYFRGIDYHQDIIDWPKGSTDLNPATFMTLYVYLHDVQTSDSPLHILPGTHKLGATLFPHQLQRENTDHWRYSDDSGRYLSSPDMALTGKAGFVGLWHNCLLHGTQPVEDRSDRYRISIRYLIAKSKNNKKKTGIDRINKNIDGVLSPIRTRGDLDRLGRARIKGNIINQ